MTQTTRDVSIKKYPKSKFNACRTFASMAGSSPARTGHVDPDEYLDDLIEVYERAGVEAKEIGAGK